MEETKHCPYCGAEINARAKKCKFCGKWIEKQCPYCGEWIASEAKKCKHCGSWLSEYAKYAYEKKNGLLPQKPAMTTNDLQKALDERAEAEEYKHDSEKTSCLLWVENGILFAIILAAYNWKVAIVTAIIASILLSFQPIRVLYCIALSVVWGVVGYSFGGWIGAILLFLASLAWHGPAFYSKYDE